MIYNAPTKGEDGLYFVKVLNDDKRKSLVQLNKVKITDVSLSDLTKASEAFMCSTTKRVLPVTKVDHQEVGDGKVGKMTKD